MDDDKGTSFVCLNSDKAETIINRISAICKKVDFDSRVVFNIFIVNSPYEANNRDDFWKSFHTEGIKAIYALKHYKISLVIRIKKKD